MTIRHLEDKALLSGMKRIAGNIRAEQVRGLQHLAEIDNRKLFLPLGHGSLWSYCRRELGFSESVTSRWINVMKVCRRFPQTLERIGEGRLTLCAVALMSEYINEKTVDELLAQAEGKTKVEIQALVVVFNPKKRRKDSMLPLHFSGRSGGDKKAKKLVWRVAFDASAETKEKLKRLQELRGKKTLDEVIGEALDALLDKAAPERRQDRREQRKARVAAKAKHAPVAACSDSLAKPRTPAPRRRRKLPSAIADAVALRDGNQCSHVGESGLRCASRTYLEKDHIIPLAFGGPDTADNLRLLCGAHHRMITRDIFGGTWSS